MADKLQQQIDQVVEDLKNPPEVPDDPPEEKKVVKKVSKKSDKKEKKAAAPKKAAANGSMKTLADLAKEADVSTQYARKKLREANVKREGRWSWEEGSKALKDARKALGLS